MESESQAMRAALRMVANVAAHPVPVLIRGESGSGKTTVAHALHLASARRSWPFVAVDCAALAHSLGAGSRIERTTEDASAPLALLARAGRAAGGTLLLEEIAALSHSLQGAALRLVEESRRATVDLRLVAETRVDLEAAVRSGLFLEDLLFALSVVEIAIPPLRERREDILPMARHFLRSFAEREGMPVPEMTARAEQALVAHRWPGNVRELQNAMQRGLLLARGGTLDVEALPERVTPER